MEAAIATKTQEAEKEHTLGEVSHEPKLSPNAASDPTAGMPLFLQRDPIASGEDDVVQQQVDEEPGVESQPEVIDEEETVRAKISDVEPGSVQRKFEQETDESPETQQEEPLVRAKFSPGDVPQVQCAAEEEPEEPSTELVEGQGARPDLADDDSDMIQLQAEGDEIEDEDPSERPEAEQETSTEALPEGEVFPKLTVGKPGDEYERQADRVVAKVMRMVEGNQTATHVNGKPTRSKDATPQIQKQDEMEETEEDISEMESGLTVDQDDEEEKPESTAEVESGLVPGSEEVGEKIPEVASPESTPEEREGEIAEGATDLQLSSLGQPAVQAQCPGCVGSAGVEEETLLQTKASDSGSKSPTDEVQRAIQTPSGGTPLDEQVRDRVEPVLEADLGQVRVHDDGGANTAAKSIGARAFTLKDHIWLGAGQRADDVGLMAHEATHVVQQGAATSAAAPPNVQSIKKAKPNVVQRGLLGDVWDATGGRVVRGAKRVYRWTKDKILKVIEKYAPGLLSLLRGGVMGFIRKKVLAGIDRLTGGLISTISKKGISNTLKSALKTVSGGFAEGGCEAVLSAVKVIVGFAKAVGGTAFRFLRGVASKVGGFFHNIWKGLAAPALKAIKRVAGSAWKWIKSKAEWIWRKTAPIRNTLARAWRWLCEKFSIAWGAAGDVLGWFKKKAIAVWDKIKGFIKPILGPLKVIGAIMVMLSPLGPIILIWKGAPALWNALKWLWNNWGRDILVKARHGLKQILPAIKSGLAWLRSAIGSAVRWITGLMTSIAKAFSSLLKALGGSAILSVLQRSVAWVADQFQSLAAWITSTFVAVAESIRDVALKVHNFLRPFYGLIMAIILFPVQPWMLPIVSAGWAWKMLPDCFKEPVINFVLDVMIVALEAIPDFKNFGEAWSKAKKTILDALHEARSTDKERKLEIANRIARMMTGEDLEWIGNLISAAGQVPDHFFGQMQEELIGMNLEQPLPFERTETVTGERLKFTSPDVARDALGVLSKDQLAAGDVRVESVASAMWDPELVKRLPVDDGAEIEFGERGNDYGSVASMREELLAAGLSPEADEAGTEGSPTSSEEDTEAQLQALMDQPGPQECVKKAPAEPAKPAAIPENMKIGPLTRSQRGRYMLNQMWKGIKKWFSCNWKWLVPTLIVAIIALIALEILTGGAVTAALPAIFEILGAIFIGVAMVRVAAYIGEYLTKSIAGDVAGAAKSLARGLAVGAVELVFALLFNLGAVIKTMKQGFKASVKAAAAAAKRTVTGAVKAAKHLGATVVKGARTAAKNIRRMAGAVLERGKLIMKGVGSGIGKGARSLDDLARKLWRRVRFRKFKIKRVRRFRFQLYGYLNPWVLLADGSIEQVEVSGGGSRIGDVVELAGSRRKPGFLVGIRDTEASALVKYLDGLSPAQRKRLYKELEGLSDEARKAHILSLTGSATAENARVLRGNMAANRRIGRGVPKEGYAAHHIVPSTHAGAEEARKLLDKWGIGVNDGLNGVFVPPHIHARLHSKAYIDAVTEALKGAKSRPNAIARLDEIAKRIIADKFP